MKKVVWLVAAAILLIAGIVGCDTSTGPEPIMAGPQIAPNCWYQSDSGIDLWIVDIKGETAKLKIHMPDMAQDEWADVEVNRHTLHALLTTGEWCTMGEISANPDLVSTPTDCYIRIEWDDVAARPRIIVYRLIP